MHIPDGYLSPQTCAAAFAVSVPVLAVASVRVKRTVRNRHVPVLAVFAAVSFLAMMFNVPIPDGTTAHAVGGCVIAVVLGPWAAVIAIAVALAFQALLFGDGGVLAYGANVLNMAIILPFAALGVYRMIAARSELTSGRRVVAAAIGGYVGINAAALAAAIEFGIQPSLFHDAAGTPLYSPYHLSQTIPAMALAHLTVAGAAEAILTGGVLAYLQRANLPLLRLNHPGVPAAGERVDRPRRLRPAVVAASAVGLMVVLTPLGLLAPGGAFGEDAPEDLDLSSVHLGAVPSGLNKYAGWWHHAIFADYDFTDDAHPWLGYLVSAVVGIAAIGVAVYLVALVARTVAARRDGGSDGTGEADRPAAVSAR
ncbi:cobalt transporter CbiM [Streptomyces sp. NPDC092296]|uniref:cobalt transporter CbiM n=1 Tax=Streptomyces sp. NPDC092296 TaxID=3366012 RepID=UPI00382E1F1B